jgi:hypothetical protein
VLLTIRRDGFARDAGSFVGKASIHLAGFDYCAHRSAGLLLLEGQKAHVSDPRNTPLTTESLRTRSFTEKYLLSP